MDISNLVNIMQKQNMITEALVKQQSLYLLPPPSIPVFKGDPLDYQVFMRAFEHGIENRTENITSLSGTVHNWPTKGSGAQLPVYAT